MVFVYIALAIVIAFFIALFCQSRKRSASEAAKDKAFSRIQVGYLSQSHNIRIPASAKTVTYAGSTNDNGTHIFTGANLIWKDNDSVCFFPVKPTRKNYDAYSSGYSLAAFPLDRIVHYATRIEHSRDSAAATATEKRYTFVDYLDAANGTGTMFFAFNDYNTLKSVIPEKDYNQMTFVRTPQPFSAAPPNSKPE